MKSPLVLGSAIGAMVLIGASAVSMTYFALHAASPSPQVAAPRPVAQAAPSALSAPPAAEPSPLPRPMRPRPVRIRTHRRVCPVPAVYHARRPLRAFEPTRIRVVQSVYAPPPPPEYPGPYWRAGWRAPGWRGPGWRGPGWRYPPRWAYAPRPGYGPGWRDW